MYLSTHYVVALSLSYIYSLFLSQAEHKPWKGLKILTISKSLKRESQVKKVNLSNS